MRELSAIGQSEPTTFCGRIAGGRGLVRRSSVRICASSLAAPTGERLHRMRRDAPRLSACLARTSATSAVLHRRPCSYADRAAAGQSARVELGRWGDTRCSVHSHRSSSRGLARLFRRRREAREEITVRSFSASQSLPDRCGVSLKEGFKFSASVKPHCFLSTWCTAFKMTAETSSSASSFRLRFSRRLTTRVVERHCGISVDAVPLLY
jgi:hypothetical protein